jgi:hypothetical protein
MSHSLLSKLEVNHAQVGPRELKDPRSKAYAIQTLYALKRYAESLRCDRNRVEQELAEIERYRHWEVLGYSSKEALLEAELTKHGLENIQKLGKHGGERKRAYTKTYQGAPGTLKRGSNSATYLVARLARDHPALAARVRAGELKAKTAARQAGIVRDKTPLEQLRHWWKKAMPDERATFVREVTP